MPPTARINLSPSTRLAQPLRCALCRDAVADTAAESRWVDDP